VINQARQHSTKTGQLQSRRLSAASASRPAHKPAASRNDAATAKQPRISDSALLKRGVFGTFHNISEAHLHRYLAEFDFRANTLDMDDGERAAACLTKPRTAKQCLRAFSRWRAYHASE
jgi:hypothetical protein